jgi:hypothetical protein
MERMGVLRLKGARSARSSWFGSGGGAGWRGADGTARKVLLSRAQFAQGGVELHKAVWASSMSDGGSKVDHAAAQSVVLENLGALPRSQV